MARHRFLLTFTVSFLAGLLPALSQQISPEAKQGAEATPSPSDVPIDTTPAPAGSASSPSLTPDPTRELDRQIEKLPPEKRKKLLKNAKQWKDLSPDQQEHIKFLNRQRKRRIKEGVDQALTASGLTLNAEERKKFEDVYKKHRRDLELRLREEMDVRRKELLPGMIKEVVAEYKALPVTTPAPAASASPASTP